MGTKIVRQLVPIELSSYFLYIPTYGLNLMPSETGKIQVYLDGKKESLSYNAKYKRIFGIGKWYKAHNLKAGDSIILKKRKSGVFELSIPKKPPYPISSQAKGDIVEDRVKELLILHGQGVLNVYKPVNDIEGIDLIVVKNGCFYPIFIQSKGSFKEQFIVNVNAKTFTPHENYYVVGARFDTKTEDLYENILLIPSKTLTEKHLLKNKKSYRINTSLKGIKKNQWSDYLIRKEKLSEKIFERFQAIEGEKE